MHGKRELNRLAWTFVNATVERFVQMEIWPRPPGSRPLEVDRDFYYPDLTTMPDCVALDSFLERWGEQIGSSTMEVAVRLALAVMETSSDDEPDPLVCRHVVDLLWQELGRRTALQREVVPLVGLRLEADEIRLDRKTRVLHQSLKSDELLNGWWTGARYGPYANSAFVFDDRQKKRSGWAADVPYYKSLDAVLAAIRLYCPGVVRPGRRYSFHVARFPLTDPFDWSHDQFETDLLLREVPCRLTEADAVRVGSLWAKLFLEHYEQPRRFGRIDETRLDVALRRFNRTYDEHDWIENLVDLTICLEALFGPEDRGELTYRLRLRVAFLLGRSDEEADELYEHVGALYDIRSRVVHGSGGDEKVLMKSLSKIVGRQPSPTEGWWDFAPEAVGRARTIARRAPLGAVELFGQPQSKPTWPLPRDFDKLVAMPSAKKQWQEAFEVPLQEWLPHYSEPPREPRYY